MHILGSQSNIPCFQKSTDATLTWQTLLRLNLHIFSPRPAIILTFNVCSDGHQIESAPSIPSVSIDLTSTHSAIIAATQTTATRPDALCVWGSEDPSVPFSILHHSNSTTGRAMRSPQSASMYKKDWSSAVRIAACEVTRYTHQCYYPQFDCAMRPFTP